ncbi:MAG: tetratricopeptide repeat-containing sulfotransferase family protein [Henriciella sp.]
MTDTQNALERYQELIAQSRRQYQAGDYKTAVATARQADRLDPYPREMAQIQAALQARNYAQVQVIAEHVLAHEPAHARAVFALAQVAQAHGDHEKRAEILAQGLAHSPANLILRMAHFSALESHGAIECAIETARHIAELEETFDTVSTLTGILFRYGQNEEALATCDRTEPLCAGDKAKLSEVHLIRAQIYRILGEREQSVQAFRACLAENPENGAAWWGLADMKTYQFSANDRAALDQLIGAPALQPEQKCMAAFARAKASESDGDWDVSMAWYHRANAMKPNRRFNPGNFLAAIERMKMAINADALMQRADPVPTGPRPIFILGLPRSGSTLVEQILASHSQIEGTLEQPILPNTKMKAHAMCVKTYGGDYLSQLGRLTPEELSKIGQSYLDQGALFRSGAHAFFTDKLPFNFEHVGLIHKILPQAVIIDTRRNPLDCGLSLYKQYFSQGSDFSYALDHIGAYYNGYLSLMDHWQSLLPGKVLTLPHEALVRDPEAKIRELLDHVRVPFEPACLDFHQTKRAIRTASSEQVRQPINARGIGAWRHVDPHLQPLKDALGRETLARFKAELSL